MATELEGLILLVSNCVNLEKSISLLSLFPSLCKTRVRLHVSGFHSLGGKSRVKDTGLAVFPVIAMLAQVGLAHLDSKDPGPLAAFPSPIPSTGLRILRLPSVCSWALLLGRGHQTRHARAHGESLLLWLAVSEWADLFPGWGKDNLEALGSCSEDCKSSFSPQ